MDNDPAMPLPPHKAPPSDPAVAATSPERSDPTGTAALRERLPPEVRDWVSARGADEPWWEQVVLWSTALAETAGARPTGSVGNDILRMRLPDGRDVGLVALVHPVEAHPSGHPEDVARLVDALNATFGDQRYVLYLRKRVPRAMDPASIARAVRLWLAAVEQGEWQGRHAVYEDDAVAIELTLVGGGAGDGPPLVFTVGPVRALERLTALDARLVDLVERHTAEAPGLPLVYAVGCTRPAELHRGYVEQLLYGTADWVEACNSPWSYRAGFSHSGRSLFSDPACSAIASLWWLDPTERGFRSVALDNPWVDDGVTVPVEGARFGVEPGDAPRGRVVLGWSERHPRRWSPDE